MQVQDRLPATRSPYPQPKPQSYPKSNGGSLPLNHPHRFVRTKNLDFSTWASENSYKLGSFFLIITTVAALFFLRNVGDTAAFQCFESTAQKIETVHFPKINWNSIPSLQDRSSPFANFRAARWIVVSVPRSPSDSLRSLVKIKGWQVLAVGNSETPPDWELKGAIFLSVEMQSKLGFRVFDFLPYNSHVRKTIGYLFAIQHGATKIYDADDRGDVIDGDLGKHFDVELMGEQARQEIIFQYTHENPNRTVVNPYIHFGQRSVWPRGLPLETVGEVADEEYYTEVFGGKQFIQQGISNGLPDVDSVFYFTRKSGLEAFDIRFDNVAPKVALPQGLMAPLNSFNTLFHSSAFWSLMLPVSISSMASDAIRGYWGQRLLWEIGGYVVIYPPTVHRYDRIESYPFSEERDLHLNVDRLIKFLISWRSRKNSLFEKILELSFEMAEERFWTENDVKMTAAWLQDLVGVGYQQPRLMSLELDRPRAAIGHGDRKYFVPQKFPSVHLGVEEIGTVNNEIGNLIRWRKNFGNVVLVMFCSGPVERTALEWRLLYGRIFKTVVILSEHQNKDLAVHQGDLDYIYKKLPIVMKRYSSADGFLFLHDNTVLNYWNLLQADKTKLWITHKVSKSWSTVSAKENTDWFQKQAEMVKKVVSVMPAHFQINYKETVKSEHDLTISNSELFYIPRRFVSDFVDLVNMIGDVQLHHKVATPLIFLSMDSPQNFDSVLNTMSYEENPPLNSSSRLYSAQVAAVYPWSVTSELEFIKLVRLMAAGDPLLLELV